MFSIFFRSSNSFLKILDLRKFEDWCLYQSILFKVSKHSFQDKKININVMLRREIKRMRRVKIDYLKKMYDIYKKNYSVLGYWLVSDSKKLWDKPMNFIGFKNFFSKRFQNNLILDDSVKIKFSDSSMNKYISYKGLKKFNFFFLRKNRIFNKSRYSRNRQLYRTGFYWCLWLNILIVYGLFFLFYRFTFNFGYVWWGIMFLFYSFIFSKVCKYNFYNIFVLVGEFVQLSKWFGYLINNLVIDTYLRAGFSFLPKVSYISSAFDETNSNTYVLENASSNLRFFSIDYLLTTAYNDFMSLRGVKMIFEYLVSIFNFWNASFHFIIWNYKNYEWYHPFSIAYVIRQMLNIKEIIEASKQ